jgi:hypothetical protein
MAFSLSDVLLHNFKLTKLFMDLASKESVV